MLADALISSLGYLRKHYSHNCREGVSSLKVIYYILLEWENVDIILLQICDQ